MICVLFFGVLAFHAVGVVLFNDLESKCLRSAVVIGVLANHQNGAVFVVHPMMTFRRLDLRKLLLGEFFDSFGLKKSFDL